MINDYKCLTCDIEFEFFRVRAEEKVECPKCLENRPEKLIRSTVHRGGSFQLKGSGWARDRYGGGKKR